MGEKSLVIDTYGCPIGQLAGFVRTVIRKEWEKFATLLGICKKDQESFKKNYDHNAYLGYDDLIQRLLKAWKKQEGTEATLGKLAQLLETAWGSEKVEEVKADVNKAEATPPPAPVHVQIPQCPAKRKREDEPWIAPARRRLEGSTTEEFDFWNVKPELEAAAKRTTILLHELKQGGRYEREILTFRVTYVSQLLPKCVLYFTVMDERKMEMKVITCEKKACELHSLLKVDGLYTLRNFKVEPDLSKYSSRFQDRPSLRILVDGSSQVQLAHSDRNNIPPIPFNFTKLDIISSWKDQDRLDVIGIVVHVQQLDESVPVKAIKRKLILTDYSKNQVVFNMYGRPAMALNKAEYEFKVVAIRNGEIRKEGERVELDTTSFSQETLVWLQPELEEGYQLHRWFQENRP